ncbi:polyketide antibiotic transporter [Cryobacterium sp. TmT2-59]|uniref:ABC transporter permease n=1 Tax=Cryobacterium sp. TmT2-59 TaxID=1259264 RepID=UPI00106AD272|nr:polyketide antibiotic transporter [Cryobacterium sp. TmT2-59]TFC87605.1 polyketide antibiotic transporter [Cryobacterium sp. TmT2-59]
MSTLGPLLRLRRDRLQVPVWIASFGALAFFSGVAVAGNFGALAEREALVRIAVLTPTILMFRGAPQGAAVDALVFFLTFATIALMAAFMSAFLAVRHSRAEEASGRAELVGATPAGRLIPLVATMVHGVGTALAAGAAVALGLLAAGFEAAGSTLFGLAVAGTSVVFLGVGLVCAQIMRTSRGANGLASALIGVAYVLRAAGDAGGAPSADGLRITSAWPSRLSPIGWGQQTQAYTTNNPTPLLLDLAFAALLLGVALVLQAVRDLDSSLIAERPGREHARRTLRGSFGLAWRLQYPAILGWSIAGLFLGVVAGTLGETVVDLVRGNAAFEGILAGMAGGDRGSIIDVFTAALFGLIGILAAAAAMQAMIRMRQEEADGSAELLLSAPLNRVRWLLDYILLGGLALTLVLATAVVGAVLGLAQTTAAQAGDRIRSVAESGLAQVPAALLILLAGALFFAYLPRASIGIGLALLLVAVLIGQFGDLLDLPDWLQALSPFSHTPVVVGTGADWSEGWWMVGIALCLGAAAVIGVRRRDLAL